jgi:hypothetical protein
MTASSVYVEPDVTSVKPEPTAGQSERRVGAIFAAFAKPRGPGERKIGICPECDGPLLTVRSSVMRDQMLGYCQGCGYRFMV